MTPFEFLREYTPRSLRSFKVIGVHTSDKAGHAMSRNDADAGRRDHEYAEVLDHILGHTDVNPYSVWKVRMRWISDLEESDSNCDDNPTRRHPCDMPTFPQQF